MEKSSAYNFTPGWPPTTESQFIDWRATYQIPEPSYVEQIKKTKLGFCKNKIKIGQGTFGKVYKADYENPYTGEKKTVALK